MSWMKKEALSCADVAQDALTHTLPLAMAEGRRWASLGVPHVELLGRGSSSHAGTVMRYALARYTRCSVAAAMPSRVNPGTGAAGYRPVPGAVLVAISQSGASPDLLRYANACVDAGHRTVGIVNTPDSPLSRVCDLEIPMGAGTEHAVAATKTTVAAALAGLGVVAGTLPDEHGLASALRALPERLALAQSLDWSALTHLLLRSRCVFVIGRGATLGVAKEVALKIAETTGIPACAYSSAEFLHGPLGSASPHTLVVGLSGEPGTDDSVALAIERAAAQDAPTLIARAASRGTLAVLPPQEPFADALTMLIPAYLAIEAATLLMGRNPDSPRGLAKVTRTH